MKIELEETLQSISGKKPRYIRQGQCVRCGICCLKEECNNFSIEEKSGIATCVIHSDSNREAKCKLFPEMPPILFESCGFYFVDTWEDNRVLKTREV